MSVPSVSVAGMLGHGVQVVFISFKMKIKRKAGNKATPETTPKPQAPCSKLLLFFFQHFPNPSIVGEPFLYLGFVLNN
jgi:hypothetical protein